MQLIKRLPLIVPIVLVAQIVFGVTSSAFQPGSGLLAAGNYQITTQSADYFSCCSPAFSVNVTDTTTVANPLVGPSTTTRETDVSIFVSGGTTFGGGCFIAGPSDFVTNGLSSAVLNTAFDPTTTQACENRPVSFPAFTLNASWSGNGPVGTTRKVSTYSCAGYSADVQASSSNSHATAGAASSLLGGATIPAESGGLGTIDQHVSAHGVALDACSPLGLGGGGKGAGPGPIGNGGFEFMNQSAGANIPGGFVSLFSFTNVSRPTGTPPSTLSETDLSIVSFFPFVRLCFVLQAPNTFAFGSGLSSASVHAVIDQSTPACPHSDNGFFSPFTVDLTWTGTGPLASIRNTSISDCGALHQELLSTFANNPATAAGTVSIFGGPISSSLSSINTSDTRFQLTGVSPQGCILRP